MVWVIRKLVAKMTSSETIEIIERWMLKNLAYDGDDGSKGNRSV